MESIWFASCPIERREPLNRNLRTDVAVIGAGITGILTAYKLQKTGKEVVLLEANRIASGQTGKTTAKITSQHGLLYHRLIQDGGEEKARQYAQANENAIAAYRSLVREEQIDCDFEITDAYVYSQNAESLKKEALAAKKLGIAASFVQPARFPIDTAGAVRFQNQAQFHPIKLIAALSSKLTIYENTLVRSVDGNQIETNRGMVRAGKIIFACHYPFVNFPGMYFARMLKNAPTSALENARRTGRHVDRRRETCLLHTPLAEYPPVWWRKPSDGEKPAGRALPRIVRKGPDSVSGQPCGGGLVRSGLHHPGSYSLYRLLFPVSS